MSQDHHLQQQRFELKYLLDESVTLAIRDFLSCHLVLDDYGESWENKSYPVHSVYLDSDDMHTYHATLNGTKNRFKLRLRYYDDRPESPVFFEVKGRVDYCILKQRCGVRREAVPILVAGQLPEPSQLLSKEPRHIIALQRFITLLHSINARPKAHNHYWREAWVSPNDNSVRVTFDRNICIEPYFKAGAPIEMLQPTRLYDEFTVLEVKFTDRFPNWLQDMVRRFNLMRSASAKYAGGVLLLGEHRFRDRWHEHEMQPLGPRAIPVQELALEGQPTLMQESLIED